MNLTDLLTTDNITLLAAAVAALVAYFLGGKKGSAPADPKAAFLEALLAELARRRAEADKEKLAKEAEAVFAKATEPPK
ncbi:MAG TPA: hypothetical protein VEI97_08145 [bacterium]|nr:hypothetical protein [bacterium]